MTDYLIKRTKKHPVRVHRCIDGVHPLCGRAAGIVAGQRGWKLVKDYQPTWNEECWFCWEKANKKEKR